MRRIIPILTRVSYVLYANIALLEGPFRHAIRLLIDNKYVNLT